MEALRRGELDQAELDEAERELLSFAELITRHAYRTSPETIQKLREVGWSEEQIAEAVYVTALFAFFNRVADAFGLDDPGYAEMEATGKPAVKPAEHFE